MSTVHLCKSNFISRGGFSVTSLTSPFLMWLEFLFYVLIFYIYRRKFADPLETDIYVDM